MGAIVEALASNTSIEVLDVSGVVLDVCKYHDGCMHACMCCGWHCVWSMCMVWTILDDIEHDVSVSSTSGTTSS